MTHSLIKKTKNIYPVFFIPLLFLSGCLSMSEKEKTQDLMTPPSISKSIEAGFESGVFVQGLFPKEAWWEDFNSPILTALVEESFLQSPTLKAVESRINQAKQKATVTKSKLFPTLFFNADDNWKYLSENGFTHLLNPDLSLNGYEVDLSLAFQYEFDFWGKYRNIFRSAIGEIKTKEAEFAEAKLILATSLAQSYFALLINQSKKTLYENLCNVRRQRVLLKNQMENGALYSKLPALQSDESLKEAEQLLLSVDDDIEVQSHLINLLVGRGSDETILEEDLPKEPLQAIRIPRKISLNLLSRKPDLLAQIWRVESLSHLVSAAKADFFPNINLTAFAGLASTSFLHLFQSSSKTAGIDPALSLPIFTAGSIKANLREKKALFDEAVFDYNALILTSIQEVTDLLSHVKMAFKQKSLQEDSLKDAEKRLFLTDLRYQGGLDSTFSLLDFQEEVILEQIKDLSILYTQYAFKIKLIKALGGGYLEPLPISQDKPT